MAFYPKRKPTLAFNGMKFDTSALAKDGNLTSVASGLVTQGIEAAFGPKTRTDERGFQSARSNGNFAARKGLSWAAKGAEYGGVWGAIGGAAAGSIAGLLEGKKVNKTVDRQNHMLAMNNSNQLISEGNSQYRQNLSMQSNQLYRKGGGFYPKAKNVAVLFRGGGTILGGEMHENMGNPVKDDSGKIVAETEREELVLDAEASNMINQLIEMVDGDPSDMSFAQLGKAFANDIFPRIHDQSGKMNLNKPFSGFDL